MISTFTGEILLHPIPFEMSMMQCSHSCVYCFANVREKKRHFSITQFSRQVKKNSWLTEKLKEGYPVCLSNNTDPFSDNNAIYTENVLEYCKLNNFRVFFQTKGGKRALDLLKDYGIQSVVYITITTPNDDISRKIEPNAPVSSERIELIKQLRTLGHEVIVGINPLNSKWCSKEELIAMLQMLKDIGVYSFVFAPLYIRKKRVSKLANRDFAGVDLTEKEEFKDLPFFFDVVRTVDALGYKNITHRHPFKTHAFDICKDVYKGKVLPTIHDFLNDKSEFTFAQWEEWFVKSFSPFFEDQMGRIAVNLLSYLYVCNNATYKRFAKENPRNLQRSAKWFFELVAKKMPQVKEESAGIYSIIQV